MSASEPADVARLRAALASLAEPPGGQAVDAERIFSALHGDLGAEERRAVVDELVRSPEAAAAWRLARELAPEETVHVGTPSRRRRLWVWTSVAAAAVLAIAVGWQLPLPPEPAYRSVEEGGITSRLPADAPLPRDRPLLRWSAVEGATYRVRVLTGDLDPLDEAEDLTVPQYRIPEEAMGALRPGERLLWQVEATVPGEGTLLSPTFSVRVE